MLRTYSILSLVFILFMFSYSKVKVYQSYNLFEKSKNDSFELDDSLFWIFESDTGDVQRKSEVIKVSIIDNIPSFQKTLSGFVGDEYSRQSSFIINLTIEPSGNVSKCIVTSSTISNKMIISHLELNAMSWKFSTAGVNSNVVKVTFSLKLKKNSLNESDRILKMQGKN